MLRDRGVEVVDADQIARDVVAPGTDGLVAVVDEFGPSILNGDGTLDRKALGAIVFEDPGHRRTLEAILHPRIGAASLAALAEAAARSSRPVFYDAALLIENGRHRDFAGLIVVACDQQTQVDRIRARDGVPAEDARARIAAQLPLEDKVAAADHVLRNDGTINELEDQVDALLQLLEDSP